MIRTSAVLQELKTYVVMFSSIREFSGRRDYKFCLEDDLEFES